MIVSGLVINKPTWLYQNHCMKPSQGGSSPPPQDSSRSLLTPPWGYPTSPPISASWTPTPPPPVYVSAPSRPVGQAGIQTFWGSWKPDRSSPRSTSCPSLSQGNPEPCSSRQYPAVMISEPENKQKIKNHSIQIQLKR